MILCCGEALIDMVPEGDLFRALPGGSVFNTALGLGRQGVRTGFMWPLADDGFGRRLRALLTEAGVDLRLAPRSDQPTPLAFVTLQDGQARYDFYGPGMAAGGLDPDALAPLPADVRALFVGGISLVPDRSAQAVAALIGQAGDRLVMLDPNIRLRHIPDIAAHRLRIEALAAGAGLVKVSSEDAQSLWPGLAHADIARRLHGLGAVLVIVTSGADGAVAFGAQGRIHCPAPQVAVIDSIGAGDSFNAGLLASLAAQDLLTPAALAGAGGAAIAAALAAGVAVASFSTTRPGADPPWAHEVRA